jgi:hypothetical protein
MLRMKIKINKYLDQEQEAIESIETQGSKINQEYTQSKGEILELMIESKLKINFPNSKIYRDIAVPKSYGKDTQIDILMIDKTGIFIIEAKNLAATLTGDWGSEKIIARYRNGKDYEYDNPIIQNSKHYEYLHLVSSLNSQYFFNLVVGGDNMKFVTEDLKTLPSYGNLTNIRNVEKKILELQKKRKLSISEIELDAFVKIVETHMKKKD